MLLKIRMLFNDDTGKHIMISEYNMFFSSQYASSNTHFGGGGEIYGKSSLFAEPQKLVSHLFLHDYTGLFKK